MRLLLSLAVVALSGFVAACGGSETGGGGGGGSVNAVGASPFVGVWTPSARNINVNCGAMSLSPPLNDSFTWKLGQDSDLIGTMAGCALNANVSGSTASALAGQTCTLTVSSIPMSLTFSSYVFTLNADGTASDTGSGSGTATAMGQSYQCQYTESATYTKQVN